MRLPYRVSVLAVLALAPSAPAQTLAPPDQVLPSDGFNEAFGLRVRFHGRQLIVAAPQFGPGGRFVVFEQVAGQWTQTQGVTSPDPGAPFASVLEVAQDTLVVGAPEGPIHAYGRGPGGTWVYEDSPVPTAEALEHGVAVGSGLLVTSQSSQPTAVQRIETFERVGAAWTSVDTFVWGFGNGVVQVDVSGNRLSTRGSRKPGGGQSFVQHTYVRAGAGWQLEAEIEHPDQPSWGPGLSALSGSTLLVQDVAANSDGRYFVFENRTGSGWVLDAEIQPGPAQTFAFATDLHLSDDRALMAVDSGRIAAFERTDDAWTLEAELLPQPALSAPTSFDWSGRTVAVGSPLSALFGSVALYANPAGGTAR